MRLVVSSLTNVIFRGTWSIGIPCRSHLCKTTPFSRLKHLLLCKVAVTFSCFKLHFKPIKKYSANVKIKRVYPRNFSNYKCSNNHANYNQSQQMTPSKRNYFHRSIQSILQFMNGLNLHVVQLIFFTVCRIAQILLTKLKNCQNYLGFSGILSKKTTQIQVIK